MALGVLLVLLVVKIFNISYPVSVTTRAVSSELSVVGEGKVDVVPDTASVQVGIVVSDAATVPLAESQVNETNNNIVEAMRGLGIEEKDIKTTNYSIYPNYNYEGGRNDITGYSGNATLTIKVRETTQLQQVITAATEAGANQVYDTQYTVDNPAVYREQAREAAIQNAREQAEKLASSLDIRLGKIVNIIESSPQTDGYIPLYYDREAGGLGGAPDLAPGSQTITSIVTLYFERK